MDIKTDRLLIDAHIRGDKDAFEQIVRRHGDVLLSYLRRLDLKDSADDVFQETFRRVHQKADTFNGEDLKPWIFKIATNIVMDGFRKKAKHKTVNISSLQPADSDQPANFEQAADANAEPSAFLSKEETAQKVRRALTTLPEGQRTVLVLAYYEKLSYREVAEVTGCSIGTVKTQMFRALKALAQKLPEEAGRNLQ